MSITELSTQTIRAVAKLIESCKQSGVRKLKICEVEVEFGIAETQSPYTLHYQTQYADHKDHEPTPKTTTAHDDDGFDEDIAMLDPAAWDQQLLKGTDQ